MSTANNGAVDGGSVATQVVMSPSGQRTVSTLVRKILREPVLQEQLGRIIAEISE
jgi:hypothetical protein